LERTIFIDQFARAVLQHLGGAIKNLPAIIGAGLAPATDRSTRSDDRVAEIFARGVCKIIKLLALCGFRGQ